VSRPTSTHDPEQIRQEIQASNSRSMPAPGRLLRDLVRRGLEREDLPAAALLVLQLDADADVRSVISRGTGENLQ
jgi:hypothetical protein